MTNEQALQILASAASGGVQAAFDHIQAQLPKLAEPKANGASGDPKAKRRRGKKTETKATRAA